MRVYIQCKLKSYKVSLYRLQWLGHSYSATLIATNGYQFDIAVCKIKLRHAYMRLYPMYPLRDEIINELEVSKCLTKNEG